MCSGKASLRRGTERLWSAAGPPGKAALGPEHCDTQPWGSRSTTGFSKPLGGGGHGWEQGGPLVALALAPWWQDKAQWGRLERIELCSYRQSRGGQDMVVLVRE